MFVMSDIKSNLWIVVAIAAGVVLLCSILFVSLKLKKGRKKKEPLILADRSIYISALGGENNIVESKLIGSRIVITLKDDAIIHPEELLSAGVASYIKMNKKLTLVVKDNADKVYERIFLSR